jgi:hypothetical protein
MSVNRYFIKPPCIVVRGKPSTPLAEKLEKDEIAHVKVLGPDGLAKAEENLKEAKAEHDWPTPSNVLTSFPVPDVKSKFWIPVQSFGGKWTRPGFAFEIS